MATQGHMDLLDYRMKIQYIGIQDVPVGGTFWSKYTSQVHVEYMLDNIIPATDDTNAKYAFHRVNDSSQKHIAEGSRHKGLLKTKEDVVLFQTLIKLEKYLTTIGIIEYSIEKLDKRMPALSDKDLNDVLRVNVDAFVESIQSKMTALRIDVINLLDK